MYAYSRPVGPRGYLFITLRLRQPRLRTAQLGHRARKLRRHTPILIRCRLRLDPRSAVEQGLLCDNAPADNQREAEVAAVVYHRLGERRARRQRHRPLGAVLAYRDAVVSQEGGDMLTQEARHRL